MVAPARWCSSMRLPFLWKGPICIVSCCHNTKMAYPSHRHLRLWRWRWGGLVIYKIITFVWNSFQMASVLSVSRRQPALVQCCKMAIFFFKAYTCCNNIRQKKKSSRRETFSKQNITFLKTKNTNLAWGGETGLANSLPSISVLYYHTRLAFKKSLEPSHGVLQSLKNFL